MIEEYKIDESDFRSGSLKSIKTDLLTKSVENSSIDRETPKLNNCQWGQSFISPLTSIPSKFSMNLWSNKEEPKVERSVSQATPSHKMLQSGVIIPEDPNCYFTFRDGVVENAVKECKEEFIDEESEGPLLAYFLLTQINHWDTDKERLLLLTPKTLVIAKYDFIALKRLGYKKLPLDLVEQLHVGDLIYPNGSLIPDRNMRGARLMWKQEKPNSLSAKWNPFVDNVPFCTFTYHPLYFHKDSTVEGRKAFFDLDIFIDKLCDIFAAMQARKTSEKDCCAIYHKNIILENYVGVGSLIHNRNALGFFKVRGKFSF